VRFFGLKPSELKHSVLTLTISRGLTSPQAKSSEAPARDEWVYHSLRN
jgi:hypothetical protein